MEIQRAKQALRKEIALQKRLHSESDLQSYSLLIQQRLEETTLFQQASCIALYHALPGEVQTTALLEKWYENKQLLLPVVQGNDLRLLQYIGKESLQKGAFGIWEPRLSCPIIPEEKIDLIIVPGVAFDRKYNRLGRGKGFYDQLLATLNVPRIGICYDFQLRETVPFEPFDRKMNLIITEWETF